MSLDSGLIRARRSLNDLHCHLAEAGFGEVYVDQVYREENTKYNKNKLCSMTYGRVNAKGAMKNK